MVKEDFYTWNIQRKEKGILYVLLLASVVVSLILYPMWPYPMKLGVFYISFSLLVAIVIINIIRYILFFTMFVFGFNIWIFPRLYDDSAGIFGSFKPVLTTEKRNDSTGGYILRAIVGISLGISAAYYVEVFSVDEVISIYNDSFDWTKSKIVGNNTNALTIKGGAGFKTLEEILLETS